MIDIILNHNHANVKNYARYYIHKINPSQINKYGEAEVKTIISGSSGFYIPAARWMLEELSNELFALLNENRYMDILKTIISIKIAYKKEKWYFRACYDQLILKCAQNLSYTEFHQAWHNQPHFTLKQRKWLKSLSILLIVSCVTYAGVLIYSFHQNLSKLPKREIIYK